MNLLLDHDQAYEMLPDAALGILDTAELDRVQTHARECPVCSERLGEYDVVVAELALLAPAAQLGEARARHLRARLLTRIRQGRASPGWDRWLGWAFAAGLAGILLVHHSVHRPVAYGWLAAGVVALLLVAVGVYARIQRGKVETLQRQLGNAAMDDEPA